MVLDQEKQTLCLRNNEGTRWHIYLYVKDLSEPKYEFLIKKRENVRADHFNDPNAFVECSNRMDDFYENIDDDNPKRQKKLIVFDDMIVDIMSKKNFKP